MKKAGVSSKFSSVQSDDDRLAWLRLMRSYRVGVSTFYRLMNEHGSAQAALEALPEVARAAGVEKYRICPEGVAQAEMAKARKLGAKMLCYGSPDYPAALKTISDPPPVLWMRGNGELLEKPMIALVGARNASSLGTRMTRRLAHELGEAGFIVVSGLARGIDTAAHAAALKHGTVAVFAGGVDVIYPTENSELARDILKSGCVVAEQPIGTQPLARHFPVRNRIISGLSRAVVVIEAALKSGSLITAKNALDQGREVMAVPGHPIDARASGCNALLRDGAVLVRDADDVIEAISEPAQLDLTIEEPSDVPIAKPEQRTLAETSALHQKILNRLGPSPVATDQLIRDLELPARTVAPELSSLELDGKIEKRAGGLIVRVAS